MTKSTITREQLEEWVAQFDEDGGCDATDRQLEALIRQSLAAMGRESITVTDDMAYAFHHALTDSMIGADDVEEIKTGLRSVFANLTAPVVSAEYPDRLPCSVLLEPGLRFGKGIKTSTMLAALARRAVYETDMAALSSEERAEFQARIEDFKALIAQPAPVVSSDLLHTAASAIEDLLEHTDPNTSYYSGVWADVPGKLRAAMLQAKSLTGNSPVIGIDLASGPDRTVEVSYVAPPGYVMVPMRLTAENGAKGALSDEFSETKFVNCSECFGDDECETCDGSGRIEITVPVTWTTIKEIWAKGVEHFSATPREVKGE
ncbi:hypothetical protein Q8F96_05465 [Klebsiella pneumoniae]|uniref:hypothetical protein n=1 Tax=Klebsiella pneumoniae TaxID=573 RepID=UPI00272F91A5|nr:hypothetical protein [Klebsiella pneumoniae]MDP0651331.1 hypothetical protein [Klebsiella pneumoniae]MDP0743577.1 hypothetical protein [Klebsiella pneumoniae]